MSNRKEGDHYPLTRSEASLICLALLHFQQSKKEIAAWEAVERLFQKMYSNQTDYLAGSAQ